MNPLPTNSEIEAEYDLGLVLLDFMPDEHEQLKMLLAEWAATLGQPSNEKCFAKLCAVLPTPPFTLSNVEDFAGTDRFMAALQKRGHHRHQFETFLLGLNLLKLIMPTDSSERETLFGTPDELTIMKNWFATAVGHDYGYPVQEASSLLQKFADLFGQFGFTRLEEGISKAIDGDLTLKIEDAASLNMPHTQQEGLMDLVEAALSESIDSDRLFSTSELIIPSLLTHLQKQKVKTGGRLLPAPRFTINHGYASALCFLRSYTLDFVKRNTLSGEGESSLTEDSLWPHAWRIAGAMALHALKPPVGVGDYSFPRLISCHKNPYAYLLYIVDNIQDWGRTLFKSELYPDYRLVGVHRTSHECTLQVVPFHENWNDTVVTNTIDNLKSIRAALQLPCGLDNKCKFTIEYTGIPNDERRVLIEHML